MIAILVWSILQFHYFTAIALKTLMPLLFVLTTCGDWCTTLNTMMCAHYTGSTISVKIDYAHRKSRVRLGLPRDRFSGSAAAAADPSFFPPPALPPASDGFLGHGGVADPGRSPAEGPLFFVLGFLVSSSRRWGGGDILQPNKVLPALSSLLRCA